MVGTEKKISRNKRGKNKDGKSAKEHGDIHYKILDHEKEDVFAAMDVAMLLLPPYHEAKKSYNIFARFCMIDFLSRNGHLNVGQPPVVVDYESEVE